MKVRTLEKGIENGAPLPCDCPAWEAFEFELL
jgi:hypothetical protein